MSATSVAASSTTTGRLFSGAEVLSGEYATSKNKYDCTIGGEIDKFSDKALKEGIEEAKELLRTCPACRQFYGDANPIKRLDELKEMGAIIVSEKTPGRRGPNNPWPFITFPSNDPGVVATVVYLNPLPVAPKYRQPCIYVNRLNFLGTDAPHEGRAYGGLSLARARGVAVLHELAHVLDVIPSDGVYVLMKSGKEIINEKASEERSIQNTWCIRNNCAPCTEQCSRCLRKPHRHPSRTRCPPLAPIRRGSIIKKFRRLSNSGLALVS